MSQLGDITKDKEIEAIEKIEPKAIFLHWELLEAIQILYSTIKFNLMIENDREIPNPLGRVPYKWLFSLSFICIHSS